MLILPNSLHLVAHQWHNDNIGYLLIGLGFFLICIIKELINFYELCLSNKEIKTENEQLMNSSTTLNQDHQLTRLITLVFALGVHYFFSKSNQIFSFCFIEIFFRWCSHWWTNRYNNIMAFIRCYMFTYVFSFVFSRTSSFN